MKNKFISFGILLISFLLFTASTTSFVSDLQNLFNNQTKELVTQKNKEYQKTKNKPGTPGMWKTEAGGSQVAGLHS